MNSVSSATNGSSESSWHSSASSAVVVMRVIRAPWRCAVRPSIGAPAPGATRATRAAVMTALWRAADHDRADALRRRGESGGRRYATTPRQQRLEHGIRSVPPFPDQRCDRKSAQPAAAPERLQPRHSILEQNRLPESGFTGQFDRSVPLVELFAGLKRRLGCQPGLDRLADIGEQLVDGLTLA